MTEITAGVELPALEFEVTPVACVASAVVTVDFFPGLLDPDYARSVGHKSVFMNTMTLFALMDRFVTEWTGFDVFIRSHEISMHRPTYAGTTVQVNGHVTAIADEPAGEAATKRIIDVAVTFSDADGITASGSATVAVPRG